MYTGGPLGLGVIYGVYCLGLQTGLDSHRISCRSLSKPTTGESIDDVMHVGNGHGKGSRTISGKSSIQFNCCSCCWITTDFYLYIGPHPSG